MALMFDGPSMGGFVCPCTIPSAQLWKMGQVSAKDEVVFKPLTLGEHRQLPCKPGTDGAVPGLWCCPARPGQTSTASLVVDEDCVTLGKRKSRHTQCCSTAMLSSPVAAWFADTSKDLKGATGYLGRHMPAQRQRA